jgi:proteic killer suppression protein
MIISFKCKDTEKLAGGMRVRRFVNIERIALRKLRQLQIAEQLHDLKIPPGNMLKALSHDRGSQYSIRINKQYRVCFHWTAAGAEDVEIVDYH